MRKIKIRDKYIGEGYPCFIIAEAGVNHNGSLKLAKKLVDVAKKAEVDAVKFQTFKSEEIVTFKAEQAKYQTENIGKKESQYKMLKKLELSYGDFKKIKDYCDKKKIIFLSTPHSGQKDVDLVAKLCPVIKVGSGDLTNLPTLEYIAQKNLPIILSTGMATLKEVKEAVKTILPINKKLILLHCTTSYPAPLDKVNLRAILTLKKEFNLPIGYSDHTEGILAPAIAITLGAKVIEKHFTLGRNLPGPDHKASLEPGELKEMVLAIRNTKKILGSTIKKPTKIEEESKKVARKSIVAKVDISKGAKITSQMLTIKRPGTGIRPKDVDKLIGRITKKVVKKDSLIKYTDLK